MDIFPSILQMNDAIIYLAYGQVFFSLGLVAALYSRRHSQLDLARQLVWLAAFGISHGFHEWACIFIPIQATYLVPEAVTVLLVGRAVVLTLSFLFLAQFGALLVFPEGRYRSVARAGSLALLAAWVGALAYLFANGELTFVMAESVARRLLGLPGASLAALGMLLEARRVAETGLRSIARDFRIAAVSFGAYAFLAGLVGPTMPMPPDAFPAYHLTPEFLGLPAPILRSIAGLGMVFGIVRGLRIFELEAAQLLDEAERARLRAAERARTAMEAVAATVSEHRDPDTLLDAALKQVAGVASARRGWLGLVTGPGDRVEIRARYGFGPEAAESIDCVPREDCPCCCSTPATRARIIEAGTECARWSGESCRSQWASVPLAAQGRCLGAINLVATEFTPETLGLLTSTGRQVGLAIQNTQLAHEVVRKEEARAQLLRKVITAEEEERKRVSRDIHDQTGQSLTAVIMALGAIEERVKEGPPGVDAMVSEARDIAVRALGATRELILGLRPAALDDLGLVPALRRLAEEAARRETLEITIEASSLNGRLPSDVEVVMFRVVQEGLNNVVRHSKATRATVRLSRSGSEVRGDVEDNGRGFDLDEATAQPATGRGLGLLGMSERAGLLGGCVTVDTAPGHGTRLLVRIPLHGE